MLPFLFKPEECFRDGKYDPVSCGKELENEVSNKLAIINDEDNIEVYISCDYLWQDKGSESEKKCITTSRFYLDKVEYVADAPKWVKDFLDKLR